MYAPRLLATGIVPAVALIAGIGLGMHLSPAAQASGAGKVVSFDSAINGKLDPYPPAPAVSYNVVATEDGVDFSATQITGSVKRHLHEHSAEFFYVVSGSGSFTLGNAVHKVVPGDMIVIPKAVPHSISVSGAPLHLVEIDAPSMALDDVHWLP